MTTDTHVRSSANGQEQRSDAERWLDLTSADDDRAWHARTRVVLQPIAAPSIMGLFGFMLATVMVGAWQAGWYGDGTSPLIIWPFALVAGGLMQVIAAAACYRARDGVALAVHSAWGAFWIGWSILQLLVATHVMATIPLGSANSTFAFWFIGLTLVTASAALAALGTSASVFATLAALATASAFTAAGFYDGSLGLLRVGGWLLVGSAGGAWYVATAMMLEQSVGRTVLPLGRWSADANVPGRIATRPIERSSGMPGVRVGQ